LFHPVFHADLARNIEKTRKTLGQAVKHCFSGFFIVSGAEILFQAEPG
jgi:hypothetical protein